MHGGMRRCRAGSVPLTECGAPSLIETETPQLSLGLSEWEQECYLAICDESTSNPVDSVEVAEIPSLFGGNVGHLHTEHIPHSHTKNLYTAIQKFKWTHAHTHKEENKVSCYCQLMMGS